MGSLGVCPVPVRSARRVFRVERGIGVEQRDCSMLPFLARGVCSRWMQHHACVRQRDRAMLPLPPSTDDGRGASRIATGRIATRLNQCGVHPPLLDDNLPTWRQVFVVYGAVRDHGIGWPLSV